MGDARTVAGDEHRGDRQAQLVEQVVGHELTDRARAALAQHDTGRPSSACEQREGEPPVDLLVADDVDVGHGLEGAAPGRVGGGRP